MAIPEKFERLPSHVKPTLYDLFLKIDLKNFTFRGQEAITIEVERVVDRIILNSKQLNVTKAQLVIDNGSADRVSIPKISQVQKEETLILQFSDEIPTGKAILRIEFTGEIRGNLVGLYRSRYKRIIGEEEKYCAVTQFESTDARRCFPCWDEPAIKAFFDITLEVDSDKIALSNMPIDSETEIGDGFKRVKFCRTPCMSSYLVAFVVGEFDYVEDRSSDGVVVRVYAPPGKKEQGKFALYVATRVLSFYKKYFQVAYPLPKIDLIALSDMDGGAMENWGLVTFKDAVLLVDETNTSVVTKQRVALVVGHELAHQWFGNLVTMEWWTHLWLNEGYATFVEFLCVDHLFPDYDIWTQFVTAMYCRALQLDALKNSHAIEIPVSHPSEIKEIFDNISYAKGASVIRMLYRHIGEKDFKTGMNLYLTRHQYGNTCTEDLWAALEEASGKPVKAVMSTWTKQVGFPVITVESSVQENDSRLLVLSQSKFSNNAENDDETTWLIPVSFCTKSNPDRECFFTMMETRQCKVVIPNVKAQDWIKLNPGTVDFYRTKYPSALLEQFVPSIQDKSLPPLDRLGILDDLFALVLNGQARTTEALDLIWAMKEEDNYTVWANITNCLEKIHNLLIDTDYLHLFDAYGIQVMKHICNQLGYEVQKKEPHLTTLLRILVLNSLITFGVTDYTHIVREEFENHCNGTKIIAADQRSFVYRTVLASDGRKAYDKLMNLFGQSDMHEEKNQILRALSAIVDADLVDDVLQLTQSNTLSLPETTITIGSIASSKVGRVKTFNMIKNHYDHFRDRCISIFAVEKLIKCTTENFASEEQANEIEAFFSTKDTTGFERVIQQSLETIRNNAAWLQRDGEQIKEYVLNLNL